MNGTFIVPFAKQTCSVLPPFEREPAPTVA